MWSTPAGRSGAHEVSLRSARAVLDHLDPARYAPVLLAIDPDGRWHLEDLARAVASPPGTPLTLDPAAPVVTLWAAPGGVRGDRDGRAPVARLDVVFPVVHGTYGEDGTLQGLLDMVGVAYVQRGARVERGDGQGRCQKAPARRGAAPWWSGLSCGAATAATRRMFAS